MIGRVHMQHPPFLGGLGFATRANGHSLNCRSNDPLGIRQPQLHFVFGVCLEIQHAAGKPVRNGVFQVLTPTVDPLSSDPEQGDGQAPFGNSHSPKPDFTGGIAVVVSRQRPFKTKVLQRGMLHHQLSGCDPVFRM